MDEINKLKQYKKPLKKETKKMIQRSRYVTSKNKSH